MKCHGAQYKRYIDLHGFTLLCVHHDAERHIKNLLTTDPGLPRPKPTAPYWQDLKHSLGDHKSQELRKDTDVAIIGSGVTGTSLAYHLLNDKDFDGTITVLDARSLCSGATGRNGGNLLTYGALGYSEMAETHGSDQAMKLIDFTLGNVKEFAAVITEFAKEESQIRPITRVHAYSDEKVFKAAKASVDAYTALRPATQGTYQFHSAQQTLEVRQSRTRRAYRVCTYRSVLQQRFGLHGTVGAFTYPGFAVWPYRAITTLWAKLLDSYPSSISLETNTPVLEVVHDRTQPIDRPYILHTSRGAIRARKVIHATNGWAGHLLPRMRGLIFPYRESVVVDDLNQAGLPIHGGSRSWALVQKGSVDQKTKRASPDLLYLHQNPQSGYLFFGGEQNTVSEILNADDDRLDEESVAYLDRKLSRLLGFETKDVRNVSAWTGVQGMTSDFVPIVGRLPASLSGRQGDQEWIAAGYNGGGMAMCWLVGKAMVEMIHGRAASSEFPECFLLNPERVQQSLTVPASVAWTSHLAADDEPATSQI